MSVKLTQNQFYGKEELLPYTNPEGTTYLCTDTKKMYIYKNDKRPYLLFDTSSIEPSQSDNKPKVINFGFVGSIGGNPPDVATKINSLPFFYVTKDDVLFFNGYVAGDNSTNPSRGFVYNNTYILKNKNEGTYGFGGDNFILNSELHLIETSFITNSNIVNDDPNAHVEELGDITGENFLNVINTASPAYVIDGATNWYFEYTQDDVKYLYGFEGPNGTYGNGQLQFDSEQLFIVYQSNVDSDSVNIYNSDGLILERRNVVLDNSGTINFLGESATFGLGDGSIAMSSSSVSFTNLGNTGGSIIMQDNDSIDIRGHSGIKILTSSPSNIDPNQLIPPTVGQVLTAVDTDGRAEWKDAAGGNLQATTDLGNTTTNSIIIADDISNSYQPSFKLGGVGLPSRYFDTSLSIHTTMTASHNMYMVSENNDDYIYMDGNGVGIRTSSNQNSKAYLRTYNITNQRFFEFQDKSGTIALLDDTRPYKVYTALLTQSGTNDPVATVLENTFSGTPTLTRSNAGDYLITLTGAFTSNKTTVLLGTVGDGDTYTGYSSNAYVISNNQINITTFDLETLTLNDDYLLKTVVEIRVYN